MARQDGNVSEAIDREIKRRTLLLQEPEVVVKRRIVELQLKPNETISRIKQIDGLLIEILEEVPIS